MTALPPSQHPGSLARAVWDLGLCPPWSSRFLPTPLGTGERGGSGGCGEGTVQAGGCPSTPPARPCPAPGVLREPVPTRSPRAAQCNSWGQGEVRRSPRTERGGGSEEEEER